MGIIDSGAGGRYPSEVCGQQVVIGHHSAKRGWEVDATFAATLQAGADYDLKITGKGASLSVMLNGAMLGGHGFNSGVVDGGFGLLAAGTTASFSGVSVATDDPGFVDLNGSALAAAEVALPGQEIGTTLFQSELEPIVQESLHRWSASGLVTGDGAERLRSLDLKIADLEGDRLGLALGSTIYVDVDGAGKGWFVDPTPGDDAEFGPAGAAGGWATAAGVPAFGAYDLLTVVTHEIGHVLGLDHQGLLSKAGIPELAGRAQRQTLPAAPQEPATDSWLDDWGVPEESGLMPIGRDSEGSFPWSAFTEDEGDAGQVSWVSEIPEWMTDRAHGTWSTVHDLASTRLLHAGVRSVGLSQAGDSRQDREDDWMVLAPADLGANLEG